MQLVVKQYVLQAAMDKAFSLIGKSTSGSESNVALSNACIREIDSQLYMIGSNGAQTLAVEFDALQVNDVEDCLLPEQAHNAVKLCKDDVRIDVTPVVIRIDSGRKTWEFRRESVEYPMIDTTIQGMHKLGRDELGQALNRCRLAVSGNNVRPMFQYIHLTGDTMQACNGTKLHRMKLNTIADLPEVLIPYSAVAEIQKHLKTMASPVVEFGYTDRAILFGFDKVVLSVARHWENYPDLDNVLVNKVEGYDRMLSFNKTDMLDAVKSVAVNADQYTYFMRMTLDDNRVDLASLDPYGNWATDSVDARWNDGKRVIGLNYKYFVDVLSAYPDERVSLCVNEENESFLRFDAPGYMAVQTNLRSEINKVMDDVIDSGVR